MGAPGAEVARAAATTSRWAPSVGADRPHRSREHEETDDPWRWSWRPLAASASLPARARRVAGSRESVSAAPGERRDSPLLRPVDLAVAHLSTAWGRRTTTASARGVLGVTVWLRRVDQLVGAGGAGCAGVDSGAVGVAGMGVREVVLVVAPVALSTLVPVLSTTSPRTIVTVVRVTVPSVVTVVPDSGTGGAAGAAAVACSAGAAGVAGDAGAAARADPA